MWVWAEADQGVLRLKAYLMHQEVLLHTLLWQVSKLLHGLIHALTGTKLLHSTQSVSQQDQSHSEDDLNAYRVRGAQREIRSRTSACLM